jgi:hypothetical protein
MNRELALKIALAVVGLLFIALGYPMVVFIRQDPALSMQFSLSSVVTSKAAICGHFKTGHMDWPET